jgi:hypothetical protein
MLWGDGFEVETVINCRVAAAGLKIVEVPSVERQRIFGDTNLRTFSDGSRVLRTILAEHRRAARLRRLERADVAVHRPRFLRPRNDLIIEVIEDFIGAVELAEESAS